MSTYEAVATVRVMVEADDQEEAHDRILWILKLTVYEVVRIHSLEMI